MYVHNLIKEVFSCARTKSARAATTLLVLSCCPTGDMYGYQMIAELESRSDHTFTLKEGTLYPILHGLENEGAVKAYEQEAATGRTRRYYHITKRDCASWTRRSGVGWLSPPGSTPSSPAAPWPEAPPMAIRKYSVTG